MADVLLTHSYHLYFDRKQTRKMQPYPAAWHALRGGLLRSAGISVAVFDTMLTDPEESFRRHLEQHDPRIVVVYEDNFNFLSKMCLTRMREVAYRHTRSLSARGSLYWSMGRMLPIMPQSIWKRDFAAYFSERRNGLCWNWCSSFCGTAIPTFRILPGWPTCIREPGEQVRTPRRPLMRDLNRLPMPARDLVDVKQYATAWKSAHGFFSFNIVSSRGCPYRCNWCAKPIYGDHFSMRSPLSVAEEMRTLKNDYGAEHLWFADDIFGLKTKMGLANSRLK